MKKAIIIQAYLIFFILFFTPEHTVKAANISLLGEPKTSVNSLYTLSIVLSGDEQTLGTDTVILYDPTMIRAVSVSEGSLYPTYTPSQTARINHEKGKIVLSGSTGFNAPVLATGIFGKITFSPLKKGNTVLRLDYSSGDTSKTGVIDFKGTDLLSTMPKPLALTIANESPIEVLWRYTTKFFPFLKK